MTPTTGPTAGEPAPGAGGAPGEADEVKTSRHLPEHFARSALSNYSLSVVSILVAVVTTPLLTADLGPVRFGVWALVGSIIPYLELVELGFASATVTYVGRGLAAHDDEGIRRAVNTSFFLLMVPGAMALGGGVGIAFLLPHVVHIPSSILGQARFLVVVLAIDMAVSVPGDTVGSVIIAHSRFDLLNLTLVTVMVFQAVAWVVVLSMGGSLAALGLVTVVISLGGQLWRYVLARRLMPELRLSIRDFDRKLVSPLGRRSGWFSLKQIALVVSQQVDILIVGAVIGVASGGVYSVAQRLAMVQDNARSPAITVFFPHAARASPDGSLGQLRTTLGTASRMSAGLALPAGLIFAVLARPALHAWVGPRYVAGATVVVILSIVFMVKAISGAGVTIITGAGSPKVPTVLSVCALVVHVPLAVVLGLHFGIVGVAVAVLISSALFEGVLTLFSVYRRFGIGVFSYLGTLARAHVLPVVASGALGIYMANGPVAHFVDAHSRIASFGVVSGAGLAMLALYLALFAVTGLTSSERSTLATRLGRFNLGVGR